MIVVNLPLCLTYKLNSIIGVYEKEKTAHREFDSNQSFRHLLGSGNISSVARGWGLLQSHFRVTAKALVSPDEGLWARGASALSRLWVGWGPQPGGRAVPAWSQICASVIQGCSGPCLGALLCSDEATSDSACSTREAATDVAWMEPVRGFPEDGIRSERAGPTNLPPTPPTHRREFKTHTHPFPHNVSDVSEFYCCKETQPQQPEPYFQSLL